MLATVLPENPTDADLKAAGTNTEHDSIVNVLQGQKLNITGTIDATSVKNQMKEIESQFGVGQDGYASIAISDLSSNYTATFTLPKGISFPRGVQQGLLVVEGARQYVCGDRRPGEREHLTHDPCFQGAASPTTSSLKMPLMRWATPSR